MGVVDVLPPSRDDFDAAFNRTVTILIAESEVRFVTSVGETAEVEEREKGIFIDVINVAERSMK